MKKDFVGKLLSGSLSLVVVLIAVGTVCAVIFPCASVANVQGPDTYASVNQRIIKVEAQLRGMYNKVYYCQLNEIKFAFNEAKFQCEVASWTLAQQKYVEGAAAAIARAEAQIAWLQTRL
jgi:hypothetical protein